MKFDIDVEVNSRYELCQVLRGLTDLEEVISALNGCPKSINISIKLNSDSKSA